MTDQLKVARLIDEKTDEAVIEKPTLLRRVISQIRGDSVADSQDYLDETKVPHGGE